MSKAQKKNVKKTASKKTSSQFDEIIDLYSRINVPIIPDGLDISFKNISNLSNTLKNLKSVLDIKFKKSDKQKLIDEIRSNFEQEKLVFVLGAGISMNFGLPSWDTLLQKLMVATLEKEENSSTVLSKLFSKIFDPSPLIAGRYLQKYFESNNKSFEEAVREVLYKEIKRESNSQLMDEIVKYCIAPGKSPNLNSIITYNFDDILEHSIKKISVDLPFKSIYGLGTEVNTGQLPIYHVHGYLPEDEALTDANQITFGESIYHKQYVDIYSWNNIVQINKFREYNCLFIGTSLTDPNTRRLLDIANQQRTNDNGSHYIFKLKYKKNDVSRAIEMLLAQNKELLDEKSKANLKLDQTVDTLIETIESFEENDLNSFGIRTIWVESYSHIPEILKKIRKS